MSFVIMSFIFALCVLPLVVRIEEEGAIITEHAEVKEERKRSISRKSLDGGRRRQSRSGQQQGPVSFV